MTLTAQSDDVTEAVVPLVEELASVSDAWQIVRGLGRLPYLLFLDSAGDYGTLGRYSFLAVAPFAFLWARGREVEVIRFADDGGRVRQLTAGDPFTVLRGVLKRWQVQSVEGAGPFQGGAAGLFGYDLCHHIERLPRPRYDDLATPDLAVGLYDCVVTFDHQQGRAWLISTGLPESEPGRRRLRARRRLEELRALVRGQASPLRLASVDLPDRPPARAEPAPGFSVPGLAGVTSSFSHDAYLAAVARAIDYIHAGDCFQVNVAQRLLRPAVEPLELYGRLRQRNPAPFAGYLDLGDLVLASASPERFLRVCQGRVETRPIKGTRPRGRTPQEDRALAQELLASAKDRAENVMIVDLLRNDLGRVCAYGSVGVEALCRLESYQYVHHLVSVVTGQLRPGLSPIDLLRAAFPGGSVTGAPKVRAMEVIAELEPVARGPYCGSLGYIGFDGTMDTNILIRTFTQSGGWMQFPVGGGIVADSMPEAEYAETLHKAEGLLRALGT